MQALLVSWGQRSLLDGCRGMQELIDLYRHNAWANERVFALAQDVEAGLLEADAPGTRGTVKGTLAHLARVEYLYLTMTQGKPHTAELISRVFGSRLKVSRQTTFDS